MQFILHRVYYKGVSSIFCIPACLPSDTNMACCAINTSSILAGGNILLTTKAAQNFLAEGVPSHPSCWWSHLKWVHPSLVELNLLKAVKYYWKSKKITHLVEEPRAQGAKRESLAAAACCVLIVWSTLHVVKSSGKEGLQEASVQVRALSYVTTKTTYITKGFWWSNIFSKNSF